MKAMILPGITTLEDNSEPLELKDLPVPEPREEEVLLKVSTCGVCHTELDEIEGRTPPSKFPMVLGHEVIGKVEKTGANASQFKIGDRVGVGWIFSSCGNCYFCKSGNENLCENFAATGRDANGGYAEYMTVPQASAHAIPEVFSNTEAAPLLCAGGVGYRSLLLTNIQDGQNLGLTGFGASGHLVLQLAKHKFPNTKIYVFARNEEQREFAKELGATWAGDTEEETPEKLHAIIDTTPVWKPIVEALKNLRSGGRLVINAIRKEEVDKDYLLSLNYQKHLWLEKEIKSVANVTRTDISEFIQAASEIPIKPEVQEYKLEDANKALQELKAGKIRGAKVLLI
ncbi:MAG: zinc-dependent alcohol dehydrogenase family protein [Thermoplasmata archaeon]|nr:MAG: zinc-dependent alcohol dehydrogenase family protein [Thermoplasmata archaeon]